MRGGVEISDFADSKDCGDSTDNEGFRDFKGDEGSEDYEDSEDSDELEDYEDLTMNIRKVVTILKTLGISKILQGGCTNKLSFKEFVNFLRLIFKD